MKTTKNEITAEILAGNMSHEELASVYGIDYHTAAALAKEVNDLLMDSDITEEQFLEACAEIDSQYV